MSLLEATEVTKRFAGIKALAQVELRVEAGEVVGLIGPNGAGKTTLFNCLYGVLVPDEGEVRFAGTDITSLPVHRRARLGMGRTFQRMELFPGMTVRDHLLVAARAQHRRWTLLRDLTFRSRPQGAERDRVDQILTLLGLAGEADRPVEALTLGRGRLLELGRALMAEPSLLLLDEPSSGLDTAETAEVVEVLRLVQRERGTAILLVEHDIATVATVTSRCYVLDYGSLIAEGPTADVLADPRVRAAYLGVSA